MRRIIIVAVAAGLAAGGWWVWRQKRDAGVLFERFPAENVLVLYVDVARLRQATALAPVLRGRVDPDPDYAAFVKQTGFDYQRDLDGAAVCYLPDRVYMMAQGRFDAARLRQYALEQGGSCTGSGLERPCRMPASRPGRTISFFLISPGVLALATAPEADAVRQLETAPTPNAAPLAQSATAGADAALLLWATTTPAALDQAVGGYANLGLISRSLAGAQRVYLLVSDRSPNIGVSVKAVCTSESQAGEMRRLLQELSNFIGGLTRNKTISSAVISQERDTVRATWTLDPAILQPGP